MKKNLQSESSAFYSNRDALFDGENNLPRYNQSIVEAFAKYFNVNEDDKNLPKQFREVLDFGAGSGSLAELFRQTYGIVPICVEVDPSLCELLKKRNFVAYSNLHDIRNRFSYIYSSNVLEHIENDLNAISLLRTVLVKGGQIGIYVPALPILFSDLDRQAGHYRRYKKSELIAKFEKSGFKIDKCYYNDCLGVPASFALKIFGYRNNSGLGANRSLMIYDKYIYPISQLLDKMGFKYFFGKNLFLLAHDNREKS